MRIIVNNFSGYHYTELCSYLGMHAHENNWDRQVKWMNAIERAAINEEDGE